MAARRLLLIAVAAVTAATVPPPAAGESLASCAQRVIRDWYTGGRVDRVYPLACYRAAIRALPSDVLQYSDADRDIARAMAFARRGLRDPGNGPSPAAAERRPKPTTASPDARPPASEPAAHDKAAQSPSSSQLPAATAGRTAEAPVRLASGAEPAVEGAALPYPVLLLGALACILLASGAVGWLAARRR